MTTMRWTWVGYLNFALLQWVGLRLYRQVEADGRVSGFGLLGLVLPLTVFPGPLGTVARALPWSALLQVPADVFLGRSHGTAVLGDLAFEAGWAVVLLGAGRLVQSVATRRLVVQGG